MRSPVLRTGRATIEWARRSFGATPVAARVLDVGAGDSPFTTQLAARGTFAVACDPQYAIVPPPVGCLSVVALAEALPFRTGTFTDVHATYAVMHARNRAAALAELARVAAAGGRLCIAPVWSRRRPFLALARNAAVRVSAAAPWPRGRVAVVVDRGSLDADLLGQLAAVTTPTALVRVLGTAAMRLMIRVRGTTVLDTSFGRHERGRR